MITYKDSGVDKEAGYKSVELMKQHVKRTFTQGVVSDIGGFGGLFALDKTQYEEPILVSGTDGVGTKLMVAFMADKHDTIGQDAVAMCVNDVLCQGAKPLFFLDYIATAKVEPEKIAEIVKGISDGCVLAGAALIGGETAEMPGLYQHSHYDIAGFSVGVVDKKRIINGSKTHEGDVLIGLASNGLHSNGFSLVRKLLFEIGKYDIHQFINELGCTLSQELLKPTRIYVNPVYELTQKVEIHGISHITGGGFYENIPRMFSKNLSAQLDISVIPKQPIFSLLQQIGNISDKEMYSTFNMGIGMVLAVDKSDFEEVMNFFKEKNEPAFKLGTLIKGNHEIQIDF